jgi:hypothetical protein
MRRHCVGCQPSATREDRLALGPPWTLPSPFPCSNVPAAAGDIARTRRLRRRLARPSSPRRGLFWVAICSVATVSSHAIATANLQCHRGKPRYRPRKCCEIRRWTGAGVSESQGVEQTYSTRPATTCTSPCDFEPARLVAHSNRPSGISKQVGTSDAEPPMIRIVVSSGSRSRNEFCQHASVGDSQSSWRSPIRIVR